MLAAGSKAPVSSLPGLAELISRGPILLVFYKISCPVCQMTLPFLEKLIGGQLHIVTVSQDDADGTRRFQDRFRVTMPTLLDPEDEGYPASNAFGITHVPSLFLMEPDATISLTSEGFVKTDLEAIGTRAGLPVFGTEESVPAWKAG
jgi:peroxiredoxin